MIQDELSVYIIDVSMINPNILLDLRELEI